MSKAEKKLAITMLADRVLVECLVHEKPSALPACLWLQATTSSEAAM